MPVQFWVEHTATHCELPAEPPPDAFPRFASVPRVPAASSLTSVIYWPIRHDHHYTTDHMLTRRELRQMIE
jgi:hypothetical protein